MPPDARYPDLPGLVIFDLDGVVYRGERAVPGAAEMIDSLHRAGVLVRFATNNSTLTREDYAIRLGGMGIRAVAEEVATSSWATIQHLRAHEPQLRAILAVGERGLVDELRSAGYAVTPAADVAEPELHGGALADSYDACVVGLDRDFDYGRLTAAVSAVRSGARLIATNADTVYPTEAGSLPGAGAMVAAISAASGAGALVIGKPEPALFHSILEATGTPPERAVVVGDNPDSDIIAARRAGIRSILVLTGVADFVMASSLSGERRPDEVAAGPEEAREAISRWLAA